MQNGQKMPREAKPFGSQRGGSPPAYSDIRTEAHEVAYEWNERELHLSMGYRVDLRLQDKTKRRRELATQRCTQKRPGNAEKSGYETKKLQYS